MKKYAYEIDLEGYYVDLHLIEVDKDGVAIDENHLGYVTVEPPQPNFFIRMKWDGEQWVEGATQEELGEREYELQLYAMFPTPEQIANSELEIKILNLLIDMEVI